MTDDRNNLDDDNELDDEDTDEDEDGESDVSLALAIVSEPEGTELSDIPGVDEDLALHVVAETLLRVGIAQSVEISLLLTDDEGIRTLNRDFRHKDEATDVLSFPQLDEPLVDAPSDQLWQEAWDGEERPSVLVLNGSHAHDEDGDADDVYDEEADDEDEGDIIWAEEDEDGEDDEDDGLLDPDALHLGDIAISRDTLDRQARQAGHTPTWEFAYLLAHGVLHLLGYDDQTEAGYRAMVAHQEAILATVGISR